ncbi:MAG: PepSY domain-containing protein [Polymorphobacter sp.]
MRITRLAGTLHKWLALFIGVQLILWFASGWFMSFFPIAQVRGEHLMRVVAPAPIDPALVAAGLARAGPATRIEVRQLGGMTVAQVDAGDARPRLYELPSGRQVSPLPAAAARTLAMADYAGPGRAVRVLPVATASPQYRGALPAWRVEFDDADATALYVAADTGKVAARRTNLWRVYDFLWGLHIMAWQEHQDINHWWLWASAALGLVIALTGLWMMPSRMGWTRRWRARRRRV